MDALSRVIQLAMDRKEVEGVLVEPIQHQRLHSFYADDVALIIREDSDCLQRIVTMFDTFGMASGLYVAWEKTKAAYILTNAKPAYLEGKQWTWETAETASKLLGYPVAQSIPADRVLQLVTEKEQKLTTAKQNPENLIGRVVISNHLIDSSAWYLLTLWPGKEANLHKLQGRVVKFVWAGQKVNAHHSVDKETICRAKIKGGLGLMSIPVQWSALSGQIILW
jgi:hypothetical protein